MEDFMAIHHAMEDFMAIHHANDKLNLSYENYWNWGISPMNGAAYVPSQFVQGEIP
jgi:hypothetical protein